MIKSLISGRMDVENIIPTVILQILMQYTFYPSFGVSSHSSIYPYQFFVLQFFKYLSLCAI